MSYFQYTAFFDFSHCKRWLRKLLLSDVLYKLYLFSFTQYGNNNNNTIRGNYCHLKIILSLFLRHEIDGRYTKTERGRFKWLHREIQLFVLRAFALPAWRCAHNSPQLTTAGPGSVHGRSIRSKIPCNGNMAI